MLYMIIALTVTACGTVDSKQAQVSGEAMNSSSTLDIVANYTDIKPEAAKERLENEKGIILLDVRTIEEYTEKHIPGSILIPVDEIQSKASELLPDKNAEIIVYCRSGRRSVTASEELIKMGYTNVYNLGGINDWSYETESGAPEQ